MPHIRMLVTSNAIQDAYIPAVLSELVKTLAGFETIDSKSIKAYCRDLPQWSMGEGATEGFVHVEVCILSGRDLALRKTIAEWMEKVLRTHYQAAINEGRVGVTVELREMDRETYQK